MADFTIWRFHQCSANFNKIFFSDIPRFLLWMAAFFSLFFVKVSFCNPADVPYGRPIFSIASGVGAFFVFIETLYVANWLYGEKVRNLAGWILLTAPAFVLYGHYGVFQPIGQAIGIAAILYLVTRKSFGARQFYFFGLLCGLSAVIINASAGLLVPLVPVLFLRKRFGLTGDLKKTLAFLGGFAVIFIPLAMAFLPGRTFSGVFAGWFGHYMCNFIAVNPVIYCGIPMMLAFSVWPYFTVYMAFKAIRYLRVPQSSKVDKLSGRVSAMIAWFVCTALFYSPMAVFPLLAVLCAAAIQNNFIGEKGTARLISVMNFLCTVFFPVCGFLVPFAFVFAKTRGFEIPEHFVSGYFAGAPLFSIVAFLLIGLFALLKKKDKIVAAEKEYRLNRCFAIMLAGILILLP